MHAHAHAHSPLPAGRVRRGAQHDAGPGALPQRHGAGQLARPAPAHDCAPARTHLPDRLPATACLSTSLPAVCCPRATCSHCLLRRFLYETLTFLTPTPTPSPIRAPWPYAPKQVLADGLYGTNKSTSEAAAAFWRFMPLTGGWTDGGREAAARFTGGVASGVCILSQHWLVHACSRAVGHR